MMFDDPEDGIAQAHVEGRPAPAIDLWQADRRADRADPFDGLSSEAFVRRMRDEWPDRQAHMSVVRREPQDVPATADVVGDDGDDMSDFPDLPACLVRRT